MSKFDWRAFTGQLAGGLASDIRQRRLDAREYEEEEKDLAERNLPKVQKNKMLANQAAQLGLRARALGATDAQIQNALNSGMNGIADFYDKLQSTVEEKGVKTLGKADIDAIVNMPNIPDVDFTFADGQLDKQTRQLYGFSKPEVKRQDTDDNMLKTLFGFDAKDRAKERLRSRQFSDGMSIAEINAAARQGEYESIFPESTMTFTDVNFFGKKDLLAFSRSLSTNMASSLRNPDAVANIKLAGENAAKEYAAGKELGEVDVVEQNKIKAAAEREERSFVEMEAAVVEIENAMSIYFIPDLLKNEAFERLVVGSVGQEYFDKLLKENDMLEENEPKDFGEETEDIPFSTIPGFTGDAEADREYREEQESTNQEEPQSEEAPEAEAPDTEAKEAALLAKTFPKRKSKRGLSGKGEWDREYEGKVNPDTGKVIIAPPRPTDGGEKTKELAIRVGLLGSPTGKKRKVTEAEYWDATYGDTHDPSTGLPLGIDKLLED